GRRCGRAPRGFDDGREVGQAAELQPIGTRRAHCLPYPYSLSDFITFSKQRDSPTLKPSRRTDMAITWRHFPAGEHGFFRAPVLLAGTSEAILIDGGFTLADGRKVADAIRASGKRLTTVYVSQSDP